jgi:hypothetical protein
MIENDLLFSSITKINGENVTFGDNSKEKNNWSWNNKGKSSPSI